MTPMNRRVRCMVFCSAMLFAIAPKSYGSPKQSNTETHRDSSLSFEQVRDAANRAREEGHDDEAIGLYEKALTLKPDWPEGRWYLSTALYEKQRFPEARDELRRFVADDPLTGPGWGVLGMSEYQTREYSRALEHLQKAMELGLGERKELTKSVFYFAAILLTRHEEYNNAMGVLMPMVKSTAQPDFLVEPLGLASLRLPYLPAEIPPDRRELVQMAGRATLAVESQQHEEAEAIYRRMVETYPKEPGVHFLYGAYLMDLRPADGVREMQNELEISPSNVAARLRLTEEYIKEEKFAEALTLAEEAVKLDPKSSAARLILGEAFVAKGDLAKGIEQLEKAREESPERVRTHWDLLRAYTTAGRTEDAKREKEAIEQLNAPTARP